MNTIEYMDAAKRALGIDSDYGLAKFLGVTKQTISNYRKGRTHFDDEVAIKIAAVLDMPPAVVMVDMQRARAQTPEAQAVWSTLAEKFSLGFDDLIRRSNPRYA